MFELSFYAEKKQKRHRFCSDFYAYDLLITNQLLYQLSYTSVEIGLPASYPLYAPKRRIMALKYNINSSGLCQAPFFTGRRKLLRERGTRLSSCFFCRAALR
ncbi:MAG: hypothetical protein ACLVEX_08940 [Ruthenibacterium lactatiformans]